MPITTHTVVLDGKTFTRKSARNYTHAVVAVLSETYYREMLLKTTSEQYNLMTQNWEFEVACANLTPATLPEFVRKFNWTLPMNAEQITRMNLEHAAFVAKFPTFHKYAEDQRASAFARFEKMMAANDFTELRVISWHQGSRNAENGLREVSGKNYLKFARLIVLTPGS